MGTVSGFNPAGEYGGPLHEELVVAKLERLRAGGPEGVLLEAEQVRRLKELLARLREYVPSAGAADVIQGYAWDDYREECDAWQRILSGETPTAG